VKTGRVGRIGLPLLIYGIALACRTPGERAARFERVTCAANLSACVQRIVDAHGGKERFLARAPVHLTLALKCPWPMPSMCPWTSHAEPLLLAGGDMASDPGVFSGGHPANERRWLTTVLLLPFSLGEATTEVGAVTDGRWHHRSVLSLQARFASTRNEDWQIHVNPVSLGLVGATLGRSGAPERDYEITTWQVWQGLAFPRKLTVDVGGLHVVIQEIELGDIKRAQTGFSGPVPSAMEWADNR
jgi:hypothetical protein